MFTGIIEITLEGSKIAGVAVENNGVVLETALQGLEGLEEVNLAGLGVNKLFGEVEDGGLVEPVIINELSGGGDG